MSTTRRTILASSALGLGALTTSSATPAAAARPAAAAAPGAARSGEITLVVDDDLFAAPIDIESFSWGATNTGGTGSGGAGSGKVSLQDFHFVTESGPNSPVFFEACATGTHLRSAELTVRKAGKDQQEYYRIKMEDVLISSFQTGGSTGSLPVDQVSMTFARVRFL